MTTTYIPRSRRQLGIDKKNLAPQAAQRNRVQRWVESHKNNAGAVRGGLDNTQAFGEAGSTGSAASPSAISCNRRYAKHFRQLMMPGRAYVLV